MCIRDRPLLFGAIGTELNFHRMAPAVAGRALLVVGVGLLVRIPAAYLAVHFDDRLKFREKAFVALAWLPKATVQAAVGAVALDAADSSGERERARIVLTVAVLAIVLTAPVGAIAISVAGPRLLTKDEVVEEAPSRV